MFDVMNAYDKAEELMDTLESFIEAIGLHWDYEEDDYTVEMPELQDPMWRDFLSELESVRSDLEYLTKK